MPDRKSKGKDHEAESVEAEGEHEVVSPRDHASGLPTGQRMHKPMAMAAAAGPTASQQAYGDTKDAVGEMNESQQMQMQQAMDKKSKQETMISNVMHKESETSDNITQNIK